MEKYYEVHNSDSIFTPEVKLFRFLKELLLKDYKIYEMSQKQGDLIPYHTHAYKEIIVMAEGHMRMIIEEDLIDLKEGDIITVKPWAVHLSCFPIKKGALFYLCHPLKKN
ncbi:MAG: cupin domain-containing protein [Spirochaetia bacterium]|nr:cupin domain-containing protein [Spirochaetia bacterium]